MHVFNFFPSFDLGFDAMRGFHFFSLCFDCSETWLCLWFKFYSPHSVCVCHFRWELVCLELHLWWEQGCWSLLLFWTGTELSKLTLWPSYKLSTCHFTIIGSWNTHTLVRIWPFLPLQCMVLNTQSKDWTAWSKMLHEKWENRRYFRITRRLERLQNKGEIRSSRP